MQSQTIKVDGPLSLACTAGGSSACQHLLTAYGANLAELSRLIGT
jgi:hypothetical protein